MIEHETLIIKALVRAHLLLDISTAAARSIVVWRSEKELERALRMTDKDFISWIEKYKN